MERRDHHVVPFRAGETLAWRLEQPAVEKLPE